MNLLVEWTLSWEIFSKAMILWSVAKANPSSLCSTGNEGKSTYIYSFKAVKLRWHLFVTLADLVCIFGFRAFNGPIVLLPVSQRL